MVIKYRSADCNFDYSLRAKLAAPEIMISCNVMKSKEYSLDRATDILKYVYFMLISIIKFNELMIWWFWCLMFDLMNLMILWNFTIKSLFLIFLSPHIQYSRHLRGDNLNNFLILVTNYNWLWGSIPSMLVLLHFLQTVCRDVPMCCNYSSSLRLFVEE